MLPYVTKTIDSGEAGPLGASLMINVGLVSLFALTHSIMARPWFKKQWTKIIPAASERSTYVLVSSLCLIAIYVYWQPMSDIVWQTADSTWILVLWAGLLGGFGVVLISTFLINHFELFGLQQVYNNLKGVEMPTLKFVQPFFYKLVRHPIYTGFIIAFWSTPTMTVGHFLFASLMTAQILIAIPHEEKDLENHLGESYKNYLRRIPMLLPFFKMPN